MGSSERMSGWTGPLTGLLGILLALGSVGCQDVTVSAVPIGEIEVRPSSATILVGQSLEMSYVTLDASGNELSGRLVNWEVRDPDVASIGSNGVVQALAAGETTIEARSEGVMGEALLEVRPAPSIALDPASVAFEGVANQGDPPPQTVRITNAGSGTLDDLTVAVEFPDQQPDGWLTADLGQTTAPTDLVLEVDISGLAAGSYSASVRVFSQGANNSPQVIPVTLTLEEEPPAIQVDRQVTLRAGRFSPPDEQFELVENGGGGELTGLQVESIIYAPGQRDGWLVVEFMETEAPARLRFEADPSPPGQFFFPRGEYNARVSISATEASNSPVFIDVTFIVE